MNYILVFEALSSTIMGFVVMWIGYYFIAREQTFTAAEFGGFITAFFGGAVIEIFTTQFNNEAKFIFWFYPVGLFIGLLAYHYLPVDSKMKIIYWAIQKRKIEDPTT